MRHPYAGAAILACNREALRRLPIIGRALLIHNSQTGPRLFCGHFVVCRHYSVTAPPKYGPTTTGRLLDLVFCPLKP
jgi:hypothetical protein